jgi:hypothetical protein
MAVVTAPQMVATNPQLNWSYLHLHIRTQRDIGRERERAYTRLSEVVSGVNRVVMTLALPIRALAAVVVLPTLS